MTHFYKSLLLLFTLFPLGTQAQHNHFIYLQTENKQPFYVKINNEILSSTSSGYLIVPKLTDSTYQFLIGFPANEWPEQSVVLPANKDAGFLLKNFEEKGWGLFNLQTFEIIMNDNKLNTSPQKITTSTDQFSTLLSTVVNDSSILVTPLSQNESLKDSLNQVSVLPVTLAKDSEKVSKDMSIKKLSSVNNSLGLQIIYIDPPETDTIKVGFDFFRESVMSIDSSKTLSDDHTGKDTSAKNNAAIEQEKGQQPAPSIQAPNDIKKDTSSQMDFLVVNTPMVNSNCTQNAIQSDVEKLERKMVSENSDESKLKAAKKVFKIKCFTTQYIRQLSRFFITSAGKYNFFDMAYPYVSDSGLYNTLESEILDAYYLKRFQALINK